MQILIKYSLHNLGECCRKKLKKLTSTSKQWTSLHFDEKSEAKIRFENITMRRSVSSITFYHMENHFWTVGASHREQNIKKFHICLCLQNVLFPHSYGRERISCAWVTLHAPQVTVMKCTAPVRARKSDEQNARTRDCL
jgi:hypothetical protein